MIRRSLLAGAAASLLTLSLTACGTSSDATTPSPAAAPRDAAATLTLTDGWAKSTDSMPAEARTMTGVFGTLTNHGTTPIRVTGGTSPAGTMVELHETVRTPSGTMQMQPAAQGFTIEPHGTRVLNPGADHIMVMGLTSELVVGTTLPITLATDAGDITITASVRAFPGAQESYAPSPVASPSGH